MSAVEALKSVTEEKKFAKGKSKDEIATWGEQTEQHLESADDATRKIQRTVKDMDLKEKEHEAVEAHKRSMEFERQLLEQKAEFEKNREQEKTASSETMRAALATRLPKLTISKFNGKIEEWFSFWGKFSSEIDSSDLAPLTKFGYLMARLEKHVRNGIEGLPFTYTEEGLENAKAILEAE